MNTNTTPEETQARVAAERKGRKKIEKSNVALKELTIKYVPTDSVRPNDYNPNRQSDHDFELLLRSIEEDGFTQPIIVTSDNVIVDGEHRWRAGKTLGYKEVPVVHVKMTAEQARIATIRHNRARGSHDIELEVQVLRELQALGATDWMMDSLMITENELNQLLEDIPAPEILATETYAEAYIPTQMIDEDVQNGGETTITNTNSEVQRKSISAEAIETIRAKEVAIQAAKTQEEREMAAQKYKIYRLNLIFTGEEGDIVQAALGDKPSEVILNWCKQNA